MVIYLFLWIHPFFSHLLLYIFMAIISIFLHIVFISFIFFNLRFIAQKKQHKIHKITQKKSTKPFKNILKTFSKFSSVHTHQQFLFIEPFYLLFLGIRQRSLDFHYFINKSTDFFLLSLE